MLRRFLVTALLTSSSLVALRAEAQTAVTQSGFSPAYVGVDQETATVDTSYGTSRAIVVRVDLTAPGIRFVTTPQAGQLDTVGQPLSQFVAAEHLQFATNANFFSPCCNGGPETLIGLAVSDGRVVAPPSYDPLNSAAVLTITRDNKASITQLDAANPTDLRSVYNAVAGSAIVVSNGENVAAASPNEGDPGDPNPRTLLGLSKNGRFLYFVTIDGRIAGYSVGTTNSDSAELMIAIGCDKALNLDGGGSTEIVRADPGKTPYIENDPSDGHERLDASAIGFTAIPLPSQTQIRWPLVEAEWASLQQLFAELGLE